LLLPPFSIRSAAEIAVTAFYKLSGKIDHITTWLMGFTNRCRWLMRLVMDIPPAGVTFSVVSRLTENERDVFIWSTFFDRRNRLFNGAGAIAGRSAFGSRSSSRA
jgi:hypothetical protein